MRVSTLAAVGAVVVLGACTNGMTAFQHGGNPLMQPYHVKQADRAVPTGSDFNQALTGEYRALAAKEGDTWYDFFDSDFFARKALITASGAEAGPEDPGLWRLDASERTQLDPARGSVC